jgi:hypothetical protein
MSGEPMFSGLPPRNSMFSRNDAYAERKRVPKFDNPNIEVSSVYMIIDKNIHISYVGNKFYYKSY